mmetsp:Transcript_26688/g.42336  ORF Transcript_26688/g.42336 Transcript_26688/m.42336 type:complete len:765 (-) Transcript_26688:171-2465(-)
MPFVIPVKRTGVSHGVYMSKVMSEYRSIQKSKYFALQRKKTPVLGFGGFFGGKDHSQKDRPEYRIVTRGFGHHVYDVAYSDNLEDIRNNEWKYCIEELNKIMPNFNDLKTLRKWLVAHFTTLAIDLGSTAENRFFDIKEGRTPLSRPIKDLGSSQPLLRSEDPPKLSPLAKTASDEKLGKMSTIDHPPGDDAVVHLDEQPRFSQPRFPDEMDRLGSDEIIQNNEKMIYDRKASADTDLMSIPIAPLALSGDQRRTPKTSTLRASERETLSFRPPPAVSVAKTSIMVPLRGKLAFLLMLTTSMLFAAASRDASSTTFSIIALFIAVISYTATMATSPIEIIFKFDMNELYEMRKANPKFPRDAKRTPAPILNAMKEMKGAKKMIRRYSNRLARVRSDFEGLMQGESDDEEVVYLQLRVLPNPSSNGDVVKMSLDIGGLDVNNESEGKRRKSLISEGDDPDDENPTRIGHRRDNRSTSMADVKRVLSSGRIPAGISTSGRTKRRKWEKIDPSTFKLRCGPNYKRYGNKKPSEGSFYDIVAVDTFKAPKKAIISDIGSKVDLSELIPEDGKGGWIGGLPRIWIVVLQVPAYAPSMLGSVSDGEGFAICFYFRLNEEGIAALEQKQGAAKVMLKFLEQPLNIADHERGPHQWKNMVRLANSENLNLGWVLQRYVTQYNAKPFLSRNCKSYYKGPNHFEVDVDIHRFNYVSRQGMFSFRQYLKQLTLDIGFVVQCEADDEMPEKLLGCVRLKGLDAENDAVRMPTETNI